jgi:malonyl-CoA O-methyltransferase
MKCLSPPPALLDPQVAYRSWAAHYPPAPHNALMAVEQEAVLALLPPLDGLTVLDAGCGTGRYLRLLGQRGARRMLGVDLSRAMLARAGGAGAGRLVLGDCRALPLPASAFDVVVSGLAVCDVPDLAVMIGELARVLMPGGILVCSTLHPRGADAGWTRTFQTEAGTHALRGYWHTIADHERACASTGLRIEERREPCIDGSPVALVLRACR